MGKALNDMGTIEGFKGYGPEQGYHWLRKKFLNMILSLEAVKYHLKKSLFQMVRNAIVAIF